MKEFKKLTYRQLKPGMRIEGTESINRRSGFIAYVKDVNPAYVTVAMWRENGEEEKILSSDSTFLVPMTEDEFILHFNKEAGDVVKALQNKLHRGEIGYKEMWNGWLSSDPWELAQTCKKEKLTILGHCTDIDPKIAMFSGDVLDAGVCVETSDGERFWCHFRSVDIEKMVRMYERYQVYIRDGKIKEAQYTEVVFEIMDEMCRREGEE